MLNDLCEYKTIIEESKLKNKYIRYILIIFYIDERVVNLSITVNTE